MKAVVQKSALLTALNKINNAKGEAINISLAKEKIEMQESAEDGISIKTVIADADNFSVDEEGTFIINATNFIEAVKKIDGDTVNMSKQGAIVTIKGKKAKYNANTYPKDIGTVAFQNGGEKIVISSDILKDIVGSVEHCCAEPYCFRANLTGINLRSDCNRLIAATTDSYRLAKKTVTLEKELLKTDFSVTVPLKSLQTVSTIFEGDVELYLSAKNIIFKNGDTVLRTSVLDGNYPEVDRLISNTNAQSSMSIKKQDLISSLERAMFIKNDKMTIVKLVVDNGCVTLSNSNLEFGNYEEELTENCKWTGVDQFKISFNALFLLQALRVLKGDSIRIDFMGVMKPFSVHDTQDDSIIQLMLPIRTYE